MGNRYTRSTGYAAQRSDEDRMYLKILGANIREAREQAGMTQRDLGALIANPANPVNPAATGISGNSHAYLSGIESGLRDIGQLLLARIARALDVYPSDLLPDEDQT